MLHPQKYKLSFLSLLFLLLCTSAVYGQEICDNGIDDDGDGQIDLNDSECDCILDPESIVLGDFEDYTCCPDDLTGQTTNGINCLNTGWEPGYTGATPDYYNTCDFIGGNVAVPFIPLPLPSGNGAIGIVSNNNYLESIGTCLGTDILEAGSTYILSFYLAASVTGGGIPNTPLGNDFNLYGTANCANFPLFSSNSSPCMSNNPNYEILIQFFASAAAYDNWTLIEVEFTPSFNVEAIVLGHACFSPYTYHFIDDIQISVDVDEDEPQNISSSGDCVSGVILEVEPIAEINYQWYYNGVAIIGATSPMYEVPDANSEGTYQVVTTSNIDCAVSPPFEVVIDEGILEIDSDVTPISCELLINGIIDITPLSDNSPFNYQWSDGTTEEDILSGEEGEYSVTVTDDNGCFGVANFTLTNPPTIQANVFGDCITGTSIVVSDNILSPGATYQWYLDGDPIAGANSALYEIPSDASGEYFVIILNGEECRVSIPIEVDIDVDILELEASLDQLFCPEDTVGEIFVQVGGFNEPYIYDWSNGQSGQTISNLMPGTYTVTVTDINGCIGIDTFEILDVPDLINILTVIQVDGNNPASAEVNSSGGTAPYSYLWSTGDTTSSILDIPPGNYSVTITDANGCEEILDFEIESSFTVLETSTDSVCFGQCTGEINIEVDGDESTYTIDWINSELEGFAVFSVCAGAYEYIITDENSATFNGQIFIEEWQPLVANGIELDTLCLPFEPVMLIANASGGTAPYSYMWEDGSSNPEVMVSDTGTYVVAITDANGCSTNQAFNVVGFEPMDVSEVITAAGCGGDPIGAIELEISGGTEPYSTLWSTGDMTRNINMLTTGIYYVTINDARDCQKIDSFAVNEPVDLSISEMVINNNCIGENLGSIDINILGGNEPYDFDWSNGETTEDIDDLSDGVYTLIITDTEGCVLEQDFIISTNSNLQISTEAFQNICFEGVEGQIDLEISNSTGSLQINWSTGENTEDLTGLSAGIYTYEVIDEFGCIYSDEIEITQGPEIEYQTFILEPNCNGASDGQIVINSIAGNQPFSYEWNNSITSNILDNVTSGFYTVTITDALGCTKLDSFTLMDKSSLSLQPTVVHPSCYSSDDGAIDLVVNGGEEPYTIDWEDGHTGASNSNLIAGEFNLTVTDANGCTLTEMIIIEEPEELVLEYSQLDPICLEAFGELEVSVEGGTSPFTFKWSNGEESASVMTLSGSIYEVTVTDKNQCTVSAIFETPELTAIEVLLVDVIFANASNTGGYIEIQASGGNSPYTYAWNDGQTGPIASNLSIGDYQVIVEDANGCEGMYEFEIFSETVTYQSELTDNACLGDCNGEIRLNLNGGLMPYQIVWSNGNIGDVITDLCDGSYTATITDGQGEQLVTDELVIGHISELETMTFQLNPNFIEQEMGSTVGIDLVNIDAVDDLEIEWITSNLFECSNEVEIENCNSIALTLNESETLLVNITDENGCSLELSSEIRVINTDNVLFIPNIFSPNNDGLNDEFNLSSDDENAYIKSFNIFDRWGNLVYSTSNLLLTQLESWDGRFNDQPINSGVFVYKIEVEFGTNIKLYVGDVTIVE